MKKTTIYFVLIWMLPALGFSHSPIKETIPSSGAVLTASPQHVSIIFSKPVEPTFSGIEVFHEDGRKVSEKITFSEDNRKIQAELREAVLSGQFTVKWKYMSLDGHSKSGQYIFMVK